MFFFKEFSYLIFYIFRFLEYTPVFKPQYSESKVFKVFIPVFIFFNFMIITMSITIKLNYKFF